MKVLFVTSEYAGLAKVGGLGQVSADLPKALLRSGIDVRIVMPAWPEALSHLDRSEISWIGKLPRRAGIPACHVGETVTPDGTPLYLIACPELYDRPGSPY